MSMPTTHAEGRHDILIVDDVPANLVAIEAALEPLGQRVVKASSGGEALMRLLENSFAVALLDVQMPEMDGYETARWIRSREKTRHLPIIFVTAFDHSDQAVQRAYKLGAVDFLFKPLDIDVLRAKTSVFIDLAKAQARDRDHALREQRAQLENEALRRSNEQLALADRRKSEFLALLGHELRNPLAPIRTSIDLMARAHDKPASPRLIEIIDRQLAHINRLVDDLLDVSRIEAGKLELRREQLSFAQIVDEAVTICRPRAEAKEQRLSVAGEDGSILVDGDRTRLVQVLANLLGNAVRYTPNGGAIEVAWGREGREAAQVFARVSDNGIGIAPDVLEHVFETFVQERAAGDDGGLGLGLALARQLARLHDGTLTAASPGRGRGSTFELRLPVAAAPVLGRAATPQNLRSGLAGLKPLRTIIVDDDRDIRELTAELLASYGHEVQTAHDGPSGLELLCSARPDVALVDVGLPGLDGYALARAFRERCPGGSTRLVAMTGWGRDSDRQLARESGFDRHVVKPVSTAMLLAALSADA
ncbi:MAG: response regulator [Deltaproteobacteria bacterium]|nr:response regulator [Deltaproteobacteria bacterium]